MRFGFLAGSTDATIYVRLRDSTTGLAKTGLAFNSAGASCYYTLPRAAAVQITLATQTVTGAHSDGGFVEVSATNAKGLYRLDLPDAAIASGAYSLISIEFDGIIEETILIELDTQSVNAVQVSGDSSAADTLELFAEALDQATGQLDSGSLAAGTITAAAIADAAIDAATFAADVDAEFLSYLVDDATRIDASALNTAAAAVGSNGAGLTEAGGTGDQFTGLPDVTLADGVAHGGSTATLQLGSSSGPGLDIRTSAVMSQAVNIQSTGGALSRALYINGGTGPAIQASGSTVFHTDLAAAIQQEATDALNAYDPPTRTELTTDTNSILTILGTPAGADLAADIADLPTVAEFEARTLVSSSYFDPATDTVARVTLVDTTTANSDMRGTDSAATAANLAAAKTVVDAIKVITDALGATTAQRLALSAGQIIPGTVDTVTNSHTPTTTVFQADDITEATADHYNGRIVIFTSGALAGQATDITDYVAVGGIGQLTVTAMTEAPANDDTFLIV